MVNYVITIVLITFLLLSVSFNIIDKKTNTVLC